MKLTLRTRNGRYYIYNQRHLEKEGTRDMIIDHCIACLNSINDNMRESTNIDYRQSQYRRSEEYKRILGELSKI